MRPADAPVPKAPGCRNSNLRASYGVMRLEHAETLSLLTLARHNLVVAHGAQVHLYMCICVRACVCVHVHACTCVNKCYLSRIRDVRMPVSMCVCLCVCEYGGVYVDVHGSVYTQDKRRMRIYHTYIHAHAPTWMYVWYIQPHTCTHTHPHKMHSPTHERHRQKRGEAKSMYKTSSR